ncbi:MAG: 3-ketoacyl-ACP reductase [Candidatus Lokiarchaeota archaeon]|nr:3-ketoacyl-ACP reductase [Candidatus Lokiarchaeota archaeon]MBD3343238.1 3-ketoacyl-ACP reductase [Candidatus Lokiarchaeota archaeon]
MIKINNKIALVTGSSHGIGKAIVIALAKLGFSVVINGASTVQLDKEYRKELKDIFNEAFQQKSLYIQADISKRDERNRLVGIIKEKFKRIDILVNNAGIAPRERKDLLKASEKSFERILKVNLQGPYFLTQAIANWMIVLKQKINPFYPQIINISSISSFTSSPKRGEYCVSKAGLSMMTKLYADRLSEYNIPVYEIQPGIIFTPMTEPVKEKYDELIENGLLPMKRWGLPEDVAQAVLALVQGGLPYSTGEIIHIDGGFHLRRL